MSATVTSGSRTGPSGKRKVVYRQDPDGVFRMKKEFTDATSIASSSHKPEQNQSGLEALNNDKDELIDLSYKFVPVPKPAPAPAPAPADPAPEPAAHRAVSPCSPGPVAPAAVDPTRPSSAGSSAEREPGAKFPNQETESHHRPKTKKNKSKTKHKPKSTKRHSSSTSVETQQALEPPPTITPESEAEFAHKLAEALESATESDLESDFEKNHPEVQPEIIVKPTFWNRLRLKMPANRFDPPKSLSDQRIISYGLGILSAFILQRLSPILGHYALILFDLLKIMILLGIVVGGVCWYAGLIKLSDNVYISNFMDKVRAKINGESPKQKEAPASDLMEYDSDEESDVSWPGASDDDDDSEEEEIEEQPVAKPIVEPKPVAPSNISLPPPTASSSAASTVPPPSPPKSKRRESLTRVTPFVAPPLHHRANTTQPNSTKTNFPQLNRNHTTEAYQRRHSKTEPPRRDLAHSLELGGRPAGRRRTGSHSPVRRTSPHKKLPPQPEDLPLVNEIKLYRDDHSLDGLGVSYEDDDFDTALNYNNDLHSNRHVNRLNSTMSKKSVLGTRANYETFLANAGSD